MTLWEYTHQKEPKRLPIHSVLVKPEECLEIHKQNRLFAGEIISCLHVIITVQDHMFSYYTDNKFDGNLMTMDDDGNPLKHSVFKLINYF